MKKLIKNKKLIQNALTINLKLKVN